MNRRDEGPRRWRIGVIASIACVGGVLAVAAGQGTAGANSNKPFAVVICAPSQSCPPGSPPVVTPGVTSPTGEPVTALITDETSTGTGLTVGSVNLTAPSGVTVVSGSIGATAIGPCTSTTPATTSCTTGSVLELRGLGIAPGSSLAVTINIDTAQPPSSCIAATPAPCQWGATAKQSNDYNGPPGNQLNLDTNSSQLGIVLSSEANCIPAKKSNTCTAPALADGGGFDSSAGSVSFTTTASGVSSGIFYQSIDFGPVLDSSATGPCRGVGSVHDEYINGAALEGSTARSFTVTITTTGTNYSTYDADICASLSMPFQAKTAPIGQTATLYTTPPITGGGSTVYEGLLPDCAGSTGATAPTVNCKSLPGVLSRSTSTNTLPDGTVQSVHTMVASFPAGFDAAILRN